MSLNGIDIASYQEDLVPKKMTTTDFIIVKATESTNYVNPYFATHAAQTVAAGKLLGCYHFARPGDMVKQADYFLGAVKKYIGKAVLALDWEENAIPLGPSKAKQWLDRVYKKTGVKPVIYMSKSVANDYNWGDVKRAGYELWVAQYPDYTPTGYRSKNDIWTDSSQFGAWKTWPLLFQYTSEGTIKGYGDRLDLDFFNAKKEQWLNLAKGSAIKTAVTKVTVKTSKSVKQIALEVIAGKWGNGRTRQNKLIKAGYDYDEVQAEVNKILLDRVAKNVIAGKWGNGEERRMRLEAAGYDYDEVQSRVNELLL